MSLFFLMCSERSGSNFITKLMNGHENVCGPSTKHMINPVARNLFRYGDLSVEKNWLELLADIDRLFNVGFSVWKSELDIGVMQEQVTTGDIAGLLRNIFLREARAHDKQHVFIKENHVYEFFPFLERHFSEARYIYLTRDPRDMALSWKKNADHPGAVVAAARQWRQDQVQSLKNYCLLEASGRAYHLRYEDLIVDTESECRNICDVLGVSFDSNIRNFYQDGWTQKNAGQVKAWNNLSKPVLSGNAKKYANELTDQEVAAIESICFYEMRHFGYQPDIVIDESHAIGDAELDRMEAAEVLSKPRKAAPRVVANMEAKKRFYHRGVAHG